jgi:signal transduction histidine kinase
MQDGSVPSSYYYYALLALTGLLMLLIAVLVVAVLRFSSAARDGRKRSEEQTEGMFVASAIQEALTKLRTQERAQQERAEASERINETIVSGLTSGLMLVDADRRLRIVNPAGRRLLGLVDVRLDTDYSQALVTVQPLALVLDEGLRTWTAITRRLVTVTVARPEADGHTISIERHLGVTVSPLSGPAGEPQGVICVFTDLTKVVALEEQMRLRESLARLGELTAGLAHEFRNGLATIHGYARLLHESPLPPAQAGYVAALRDETESLNAIVTNFLNFARPASFTPSPVELAPIVAGLQAEFGREVAQQGGALTASGRFGRVDGDEVLLRQALSNLCRNALEACQEAGATPQIRIEGFVDASSGTQVVTVGDNGPGVDPSKAERIFQPFFTTKSSGTGLGLALVMKIVVTHNGRVSVANQPEGGAVFEVRLPLTEGATTSSIPREFC